MLVKKETSIYFAIELSLGEISFVVYIHVPVFICTCCRENRVH